jgi:ssDNA-binding Zn-finger/Zn-ribbon topoisomerase 1
MQEYCPKCLIGEKIERSGKYGVFIGCTRYPKCNYIEKTVVEEKKESLEIQADEILRKNGRADLIL